MSPELAFHQTGGAFFWMGFLLITAAGSCALLLGLLILLQSAAPALLGRSTSALRERPFVSLGLGTASTVGLLGLAAVGKTLPAAGAFAVSVFATLGFLGLTATAENLGRRIAWISGREGSRLSNLSLGWLVFFGAACVPYIGWLLVLPWGVTSGIGALLQGAISRKAPSVSPES